MAKCFGQKVGSDCVNKGKRGGGGGWGGSATQDLGELLLEKTEQLGMDPSVFGMHSLWAGGATAAVWAGVAHHLFKRHGH